MRAHTLAAFAALSLLAMWTAAEADPIQMTEAKEGSRELDIAKAKFPDLADAKVMSSIVELGGGKDASLALRFVSPGTCADGDVDGACRTAILMVVANDWSTVFDRRAKTVELGDPGYAGMKNIVVNGGYENWTWNGSSYKIDVAKLGTPVATAPAPKASVNLLLEQFGTSVERLQASKGKVAVSVANVSLHEGKKQILVRLEGPGVCGMVLGCPWRVLENTGKTYRSILDGYGTQKFAVLPVVRAGWHDVAAATPKGFVVFGWGGESYAVADQYQGGK